MIVPSLSELYLAFRQAKATQHAERRGIGLVDLAEFEVNLADNLKNLQARLMAGRGWFTDVDIGELYVVPKRLVSSTNTKTDAIVIGGKRHREMPDLEVQLRLRPTVEFAIVEIIYLWRFGPFLDSVLSPDALGYRLDVKGGDILQTRHRIFEYWPEAYRRFRTIPIKAARATLVDKTSSVAIFSGDFASYYDSIDASFLLHRRFIKDARARAKERNIRISTSAYMAATRSLLRAYGQFHALAAHQTGLDWTIGIPIGAITSRVIANLALATVDRRIRSNPKTVSYSRYVDDIVVVLASTEGDDLSFREVIQAMLPVLETSDDAIQLNARKLGRAKTELVFQLSKTRIHHLSGVPGEDFLTAVSDDFRRLVSERRAFLDPSLVNEERAHNLTHTRQLDGTPLTVLRDADRVHLEHYAISTTLGSLEKASTLLPADEARQVTRSTFDRLERALDNDDNWVDSFDLMLRLFKLGLATDDVVACNRFVAEMNRRWQDVNALRAQVRSLTHRARQISTDSAWTGLRDYFHEARVEAATVSLTMIQGEDGCLAQGLVLRSDTISYGELAARARLLADADLREHSREDDRIAYDGPKLPTSWLRTLLRGDQALKRRLDTIRLFVERCQHLGDRAWALPPAKLFLCTRPPSYFDISRRWLYNVETKGFGTTVFDDLLHIVNAIRGTQYRNPIARMCDESTIEIGLDGLGKVVPIGDPRLILGNLVATPLDFLGASTPLAGSNVGNPNLTWTRLRGLAILLARAELVAKNRRRLPFRESLLVLPELSVPRHWFRELASHTSASRIGLVVGLEYLHDISQPVVLNQVFAALPGGLGSVAVWPWTKQFPAREEAIALGARVPPLSFYPVPKDRPRTVVKSVYGDFSVLICSEMIEARRVSDLLKRVEIVVVPSWNKDTAAYDSLIQSVGLQLHAILGIANNGHYSDCRAWAPLHTRWRRDLCRLIERDENDVVSVVLPLSKLRMYHQAPVDSEPEPEWRPLPPNWS
jgi:hypothetical protein